MGLNLGRNSFGTFHMDSRTRLAVHPLSVGHLLLRVWVVRRLAFLLNWHSILCIIDHPSLNSIFRNRCATCNACLANNGRLLILTRHKSCASLLLRTRPERFRMHVSGAYYSSCRGSLSRLLRHNLSLSVALCICCWFAWSTLHVVAFFH